MKPKKDKNNKFLALSNIIKDISNKEWKKYENKKKIENELLTIPEYYSKNLDTLYDQIKPKKGNSIQQHSIDPYELLESLIDILKKLDTLGFERSDHQMKFHKAFICASLRIIFGKKLYKYLPRLIKLFGIKILHSDVIVCTPRRWGKTMGVALYVAAFLWSQPGLEVSVYSPGRRASRKLLVLIWKIIVALSGSHDCIITFNQEQLSVRNPLGFISTCGSYPSRVQIDKITLKYLLFLFFYFPNF